MAYLPSIRQIEIGDKFSGIVTDRRIVTREVDGEEQKSIVFDLHLDEPRTQGERESRDWSWWLSAGQAQVELHRRCKEAEAAKGSPLPGDWISCELAHYRPTKAAHHNPKKVYTISFLTKQQLNEKTV